MAGQTRGGRNGGGQRAEELETSWQTGGWLSRTAGGTTAEALDSGGIAICSAHDSGQAAWAWPCGGLPQGWPQESPSAANAIGAAGMVADATMGTSARTRIARSSLSRARMV